MELLRRIVILSANHFWGKRHVWAPITIPNILWIFSNNNNDSTFHLLTAYDVPVTVFLTVCVEVTKIELNCIPFISLSYKMPMFSIWPLPL